jgi:hypothetical protein
MAFVGQLLAGHLLSYGTRCHPILLAKKIKHDVAEAPGGVLSYEPVYRHISAAMREHRAETSFVTTMFDFYAFPRDFPDFETYAKLAPTSRCVAALEEAMFNHLGRNERFIPNVQLHEFEALLFARLEVLRDEFEDDRNALEGLDRLIASVRGMAPEEIDETIQGAPSRRLSAHIPYRKTHMGPRVVKGIGLEHLRSACPHFGDWLTKLERLSVT